MTRWAFAFAVAALFGATASRFPVDDSDVFWHLASGRWMVEHGAFLRVDSFSFTIPGRPVPLHQWLGDIVLWVSYALGAWWGVLALRVAVVTALAAIVVRAALARSARPAVAALAAFPALALSRFVWGDRPELVGLLCFAVFVSLALAAREGDRLARWSLPPLMIVWTNLHGGFVVGVVLLAVLAVEAWLFDRPRRLAFAAAAVLGIAATLVNPAGLAVYDSPGWHFTNPPRFIQEWGLPDVTSFPGLLYASTLFGSLALALLTPASKRATTWIALLAPLAFLSLSALRHMPLFAVAAVPFLAERLTALLATRASAARPAPAAVGFAFAALVLAAGLATAPREPDLEGYPSAALATLRAEPGRLFNDYDWGGYLIWAAPEHPVFIDGRLVPYVGRWLDDYRELIGVHERWREVLEAYDVTLVLVRPSAPLAVRLAEAGWSTLHVDGDAVLLRRP